MKKMSRPIYLNDLLGEIQVFILYLFEQLITTFLIYEILDISCSLAFTFLFIIYLHTP